MKDMNNGESSYRRFLEGEAKGLEELVIAYNKKLIFYLLSIVNNLAVAEDLAADSFLKLIVKKPRLKNEAAFKTYLYRVGYNGAMDYIRSLKNGVEKPESDEYAADIVSLEEAIIKDEQKRQLHSALSRINPEYRSVLYLLYFEEMSYDDAARALRKSRKQINNLAYRAKRSLESELKKEGFVYEDR